MANFNLVWFIRLIWFNWKIYKYIYKVYICEPVTGSLALQVIIMTANNFNSWTTQILDIYQHNNLGSFITNFCYSHTQESWFWPLLLSLIKLPQKMWGPQSSTQLISEINTNICLLPKYEMPLVPLNFCLIDN